MARHVEAHIEVNAPTSGERRVERLDDGRAIIVPATISAAPIEPDPRFPAIDLTIDAVGGSVVVTRVQLTGSRDHPLDSTAVRNWSLPRLTQLAAREMTLKVARGGGYEFDDTAEAAEIVTSAIKKRSTVDDDRLAEVAQLYRDGGVQAVQDTLFVSRSQAYRLIKAARGAGMIHEEEQ